MIPTIIVSGFLGAGKTTALQQLLSYWGPSTRCLLIENDLGEVTFDSQVLARPGVQLRELTAGCICCTLQGDFAKALEEALHEVEVDVICIEPSGVGKLSEVLRACEDLRERGILHVVKALTWVDAMQAPIYAENFGAFYRDQLAHASAVMLTRATDRDVLADAMLVVRACQSQAPLYVVGEEDTSWIPMLGLDRFDLPAMMQQEDAITPCPCHAQGDSVEEACHCGSSHVWGESHCDCHSGVQEPEACGHGHVHAAHGTLLMSETIPVEEARSLAFWQGVLDVLPRYGQPLVRAKGLVPVATAEGTIPYELQLAGESRVLRPFQGDSPVYGLVLIGKSLTPIAEVLA